MYTLLIVDDESLVRNSIMRIIDWESIGFTTIYSAEDGQEALEICRKHKVNLVLTDIVMPFMDGMELSRHLTQEFPEIHIVVLTGHEDFEYAKQSVELGVKNYILKPVGASTLYTKIKSICKKLNMESSQRQYIAKMKLQIHQSLPILQEKFLYNMVCTRHSIKTDISKRIETLELPLNSSRYMVGIVEADLTQIDDIDTELYLFTEKNIVRDCIGSQHCIFDDNNNKVIIIFNLDSFGEDDHFIAYSTLQVIQKTVCSVLKISTTCAIGSSVKELMELYHSYHEANKALDCRYSLGTDKVYDILDLNYIEKSFFYPFEGIKSLIYNIKFSEKKDIEQSMEVILSSLTGARNLSTSNIKMVFVELITSLLKEMADVKTVSTDVWNEGFSLYRELENLSSLRKAVEKMLQFSIKVSEELRNLRLDSSRMIIQDAKQYIDQHYNKEELSLSMTALKVSVSTGYLSALFKKETGINFIDYLTNVRMGKAMDMLKNTDKKAYEIAYEIGFSNPHYFSVSFKKFCGKSPSEFRSSV